VKVSFEKRQRAPKNHDWSQYKDHYVAINCSTDAIVPAWASILVAVQLAPLQKSGGTRDLNASLYETILPTIDYTQYQNKATIIKVVLKKPVPTCLHSAAHHLQPYARSIMYEACSAVPLTKKKIE
jgi:hypothetical protein